MYIYIRIHSIPYIKKRKLITLEVEPDNTIEDIKYKIQDKVGIQPDLQILTKDRQIRKYEKDDYTLKDYNIKNHDTLDLYPIPKYTLCSIVYNDLGEKFEIKTYNKYNDDWHVKSIKEAITDILGIATEYQQLSLNERILEDNSSINPGVEIKLTIKMIDKIIGYV